MRWARRAGRMERVKFAELKRAWAERGGRPCLHAHQYHRLGSRMTREHHLTRSAKVRGCSGLAASSAMWSSVTVTVLRLRGRENG